MAELSKLEHQVLEALVDNHAETRRGTQTAIIKAACNARNGKARARIEDALLAMAKRGLVIGGPMGWVPTREAVTALEGVPETEAPELPDPTVEDSLTVPAPSPGASSTAFDDQWSEERIDAIGQNGPTGEHYAENCDHEWIPEGSHNLRCVRCHCHIGIDFAGADGPFGEHYPAPMAEIQGDGNGEALPPVEYPVTVERMAPAVLPMDLLQRCAVMQLALMADARRRYDQGDRAAAGELSWLMETGMQLLAVGGEA